MSKKCYEKDYAEDILNKTRLTPEDEILNWHILKIREVLGWHPSFDLGNNKRAIYFYNLLFDDTQEIKTAEERFIFDNDKLLWLKLKNSDREIKVGDTVCSLRYGFGSIEGGQNMIVTDIADGQIHLESCYDEKRKYLVKYEDWFKSIFVYQDNKDECKKEI